MLPRSYEFWDMTLRLLSFALVNNNELIDNEMEITKGIINKKVIHYQVEFDMQNFVVVLELSLFRVAFWSS